MTTRRVATGTDAQGLSFVARDEYVEPITVSALPGFSWQRLWSFDELPEDPADWTHQSGLSHFPPVGGVRFTIFTVPPAGTAVSEPTAEQLAELDRKLPGRGHHMENSQDGMHRTASVDLIVVLSGAIVLELDGGVTVNLSAGDSVVQNGTRHAWRNTTDHPCVMAVVLVGAGAGHPVERHGTP